LTRPYTAIPLANSRRLSTATQEESRIPDDDAVRRAKQEIQTLVQEVVELSKSEIEQTDFFAALLDRSITALAAIGGVVWMLEEGAPIKLEYQVNLQQTGLISSQTAQAQHGRLLTQIVERGEATIVAPHSGTGVGEEAGPDAAANPTDYLMVVAPIRSDRGIDGVVEVFQRTGAPVRTQRGYLRFLEQMCELAGEYLKTRRLRHFVTKQSLWEQLESFTASVHTKLDSRQTAYTIANEGRRLIGCDRVTVVLRKGGKYAVEAISGQDTFDKRSNVVSMLRKLSAVVARSGEDLWYTGDTSDLSPQVESAVNEYVDESHTKQLAVLPLRESDPHADDKTRSKSRENILGAIVIEQLVDSRAPEGMLQRVDVVRRHSATALTNAQSHEGLFLLPLWRTIGKSRVLVTARNLPKTILASIVLASAALAMWLVPYDFTVVADGKLQPVVRGNVFAALDGTITEVTVKENQFVEAGEIVARQRSYPLEAQMVDLDGEIASNAAEYASTDAKLSQLEPSQAARGDYVELSMELARLDALRKNLQERRKNLEEQIAKLQLRSPIDGEVVTWKVEELLGNNRPVTTGTRIMEIADPSKDWEVEVDLPEAKMGHVWRHLNELREEDPDAQLAVTFMLATHSGEKLTGRVVKIHNSAEVAGEKGNTVRMGVAFNQQELMKLVSDESGQPRMSLDELKQNLKVGADVKAKIHCGRAPIGYVWFHELWEFIQSRILFSI
jgi:multidrug efflux pump subunit AcrA (membrane-fusion protein)